MNAKQVVLVTGASTGFGRLFTETLARRGHTVFATMRDPAGKYAKNAAEIRGVRVNRAVLPHRRRQRSGVIMPISSGAGRVILHSAGFYCTSKFAMEALT